MYDNAFWDVILGSKVSEKDARFFNAARDLALSSNVSNAKLGSVIVYKNKVIGSSTNKYKSHPIQKVYVESVNAYNSEKDGWHEHHYSIHSELAAIMSVRKDMIKYLPKSKLYVFRVAPGLEHEQGLARPCKACMAAIKDYGINTVHYSTEDGFAKERILV